LNPLYFTILSVPAKERASANIRSLDNSPGIGLLERHTSGGMFMINAARHCQWAAAMGAATPDSGLRDSQSYWFRECADACASAALTLFHTGHLPPEEALRCARLCRRCARECQKRRDPYSRYWAQVFQQAAEAYRDWTQREPIDFRSEEHTSELQSRENLVCRLLLEKKKLLT